MKIDVIIPVYKPGKELFVLLDRLSKQTVAINRIILMNTEEKYFQQLIYGTDFAHKYKNVEVHHVSQMEFDHGKTRALGVEKSNADIFVMMTQDAMPENTHLIECLVQKLQGDVAVAYARQLPGKSSSVLERFSRQFNYPEESRIKSLDDLDELGIKTFFCSDVCAAYRREVYEKLGGFIKKAIFNEDMIYASGAIHAGYKIAYQADAKVIHSHNYSCMQQFHRNFDLGVSQAEHPEVFAAVKSESEGMRMVKAATSYLKDHHMIYQLPYFYLQCFAKYAGYLLGKRYKRLPKKVLMACTASPYYWKK